MAIQVTSYSTPLSKLPEGPKHPDYSYYFQDWVQIRDCVAGERAIKTKTTIYLPRLESQKDQDYTPYLARSVFYNAVSRTIEGLMGSIFRRPHTITNFPGNTKLDLKKITKDGESFTTFLKTITEEVITLGRVGALVDLPSSPSQEPQPYLCVYAAENILYWETGNVNGKRALTSVLLMEVEYSRNFSFVTKQKEIYRQLYLTTDLLGKYEYRQAIYEMVDGVDEKGGKSRVLNKLDDIKPEIGGKSLEYIPFMFFGPKSLTPIVQKSPVYDISTLNLAHFRSSADLEHGRHYAAMPVYWVTGADDNQTEFKVGPNIAWKLGTDDKAGLVEFTGQGLKSLETSCLDKERQIASLGGRLVGPRPGTAAQSTESSKIQEDGEEATLLNIAQKISEGSTILLEWMFQFAMESIPEDLSVELNQDFSQGEITAREMRAIQSLWEASILPLDVLYKVFREAGIVPSYMQLDEFKALLKNKDQIPEPEPAPTLPVK
jgi:hypothetical protein